MTNNIRSIRKEVHITLRLVIFATILAFISGCGSTDNKDHAGTGRADNVDNTKNYPRGLTFCNPLNIEYRFAEGEPSRRMAADPVIILFQDYYYLFSTGSSEYWFSYDLVNWILIPEEISELPDNNTAPAVTVVGDKVYYIPSSNESGLFYTSTNPKTGKWELATKSIPAWDPALFCDDDGKIYYYWGCSNRDPIQGAELDRSTMQTISETKDFFRGDSLKHGWERRGDRHELPYPAWIEGPWMTKHQGTYYLQYAAPGTEFKSYGDGIYTSDSPLGPFKYEPYSPFSHKPGGFIGGAGHGATFQDKYGNYWRVVTMVISAHEMFERRLGIIPAGFDDDGIMYTNTILGDFPQVVPMKKIDLSSGTLTGWMLLSYGKDAESSSSLPDHDTQQAFDENIRTWWCAETSNQDEWLKVDLGSTCLVNAVQVNFAEHETNLFGRKKPVYHQYRLEYSKDGKKWKTLIDKSNNLKDIPHDYIQLSSPVKTRFIRLVNIHTPGDGPFAVRDLRIFGNGLDSLPLPAKGLNVERKHSDRRSAKLSWNMGKDATGYIIRYGIRPDKLYNHYQVMGNSELVINSLNSDAPYYFTVDAFNENGYTKGHDITESK